MSKKCFAPCLALVLLTGVHAAPAPSLPPVAPVKPVTDDYFGTKVVDPYRWMETPDSPELLSWMKSQNTYAREVLGQLPGRDGLFKRLEELSNAGTTVYNVVPIGEDYLYYKLAPGDNTPKLYIRHGTHGAERLLVNPESFDAGSAGGHHAIDYFVPSWDGRYVAVGISQGGSELSTLYVIESATGRDLGVHIVRAVFGAIAWRPDNDSFFYFRLRELKPSDPPSAKYLRAATYLHILPANPAGDGDTAVVGFNTAAHLPVAADEYAFVATTPASPYAIAVVGQFVRNERTLYATPLAHLADKSAPWVKVADYSDDVTQFDLRDDQLYLLSHKGASRFQVLETSLDKPDVAHARVVVPKGEAVVTSIGVAKDALYVQLVDGGLGRVLTAPFSNGPAQAVALPYDGAISEFVTDPRVAGVLMKMTSWTEPQLWYQYDPATGRASDTGLRPRSPVDYSAIESREVKVTSYDGTQVPLSIILKKGLALDGSHPLLLEGYGSYGIRLDPGFDPTALAWLERGGILATAHIRGGGEYGEDWHVAGQKGTKLNTVFDFIACGQYLIDRGYTSSKRMGAEGGSAGGITVGGALTWRPGLFAAVLDDVGTSDTLRMEFTENGPTNIPEFGSVKTPEGFHALYAMSAYAHVRDGVAYPAVMLTTGINDPRVAPWEVAKMAARLEAASASGKPVLLRVDFDAGHGYGSTKTQENAERADEWAFLLWQFGDPAFQPTAPAAAQ